MKQTKISKRRQQLQVENGIEQRKTQDDTRRNTLYVETGDHHDNAFTTYDSKRILPTAAGNEPRSRGVGELGANCVWPNLFQRAHRHQFRDPADRVQPASPLRHNLCPRHHIHHSRRRRAQPDIHDRGRRVQRRRQLPRAARSGRLLR